MTTASTTAVKQATLYDPAGKAKPVVVDVGSKTASDFQSKGWTLTKTGNPPYAGNLPVAQDKPATTAGGTKTMQGYDVNNGGAPVFVTPGKYYSGISATPVTDMKMAADVINSNQESDYSKKAAEDTPPTRGEDTKSMLDEYSKMFSGGKDRPSASTMESTYNSLRDQYKVSDLESQLADASKEEADIRARVKARKEYEANKPVSMGVISGKQSEIEKQEQDAMDAVIRNKTYLSDQLNFKYNMVNTMMNLKQTDYKNAVDEYDSSFNKNLQMINFVRGVQKDVQTEKDKKLDNSRANFQIMANAITSGGMDYADLPADQKTMVSKLELESGLPMGFLASLKSKNPKSDIISTNTRQESNGDKYADIIMRDTKTGKITVEHQFLGKEKMSGNGVDQSTKDRQEEVRNFQKDAGEWITKLDEKDEFGNLKFDWGTAYDSMKVKYPQFETLIDESLGGGYDTTKKEWTGRAKR